MAMLLLVAATGAQGQGGAAGASYSFVAAQDRLSSTSSALTAARAGVDASQNSAQAVSGLNLPILSIDAQYFRYQKTLEVSLTAARNLVESSINGFLASLPVTPTVPPAVSGLVAGALKRIPDSLSTKVQQNIWRPTVTLLWPIYTGGMSGATQDAAQASARQAQAELMSVSDQLGLQLVAAYFGQQLAAQVVQTSQQNLDRFQRHLDNALKIERQGMLSKAQRLQVEVARNAAERQLLRARNDYETAQAVLTRLLNESGKVQPSTPLFAQSRPLPPAQQFVDEGRANSPALMRLAALRDISKSGVKAAQSLAMPQVYGFGSYNFNSDNAVLPDPDWIVGVGVHYTLFSNVDRQATESAARAREQQAEAAWAQAGNDVATLIERSWQGVETARQQFLLLATNMTAAEENVRVHDLGFREGQANATELIDAQVALSVAQTQRAAAAYEYDLALAQLLAASGRMQEYAQHVARADQTLSLP
ncbi:TolC family protein [Variovorax dokdonensis]|uniref:TolC family protein n=1 Tax=Variovorax dokdonensis TaxID=344883 RepID=A0ABT7NH99_9BURK|nr:TolC family protein [Variovorax dokdonensis]MDM0047319.1 TolC family protein [Variovorax dokdonensis]